MLCKRLCLHEQNLSATRCTAAGTDEATFLVNQGFVATVRTFLALGFGAVQYVFLQGAFYTVLPSVDAFAIQRQ